MKLAYIFLFLTIFSSKIFAGRVLTPEEYKKMREQKIQEFNESEERITGSVEKSDNSDDSTSFEPASRPTYKSVIADKVTGADLESAMAKTMTNELQEPPTGVRLYFRILKNAPECFANFIRGLYSDRKDRDESLIVCYKEGGNCEKKTNSEFQIKLDILKQEFDVCLRAPSDGPELHTQRISH